MKVQSTVGVAIPRQMRYGCMELVTEQGQREQAGKQCFFHGLFFRFCLQVPALRSGFSSLVDEL